MFKQFPRQIQYIVGNEACERFSYYGMRSILVIFMTKHLMMASENAVSVYHLFAGACYLLPLLGAFISDRFLGKYKTILYLSIVYCLGHLTLALWENQTGLYWGLALIALGAGGIKPCVSAHVGDQFTEANKSALEKVFDIFYWSINFGAFFSTILIPWVLVKYGPSLAFGIPGILMAIATLWFWMGRKHYVHVPPTGKTGVKGFLPVFFYALTHQGEKKEGQKFFDVARSKFKAEEVEGAQAAFDIFKLFITVSVFWALFDQSGSTWVLQAEKMDPNFLGMQWEASQMQALNPIMVMVLIPLFAGFVYPTIEKSGYKMTALRKMTVGMLLAGFSFVMIALLQQIIDAGGRPNIGWQALPYLAITVSEIMVSITGLEFAYTQAPRAMKSTIMSFWLLTVFVGNMLAASIAKVNVFQGAMGFWFYAGLMFVVGVIFAWSASRFKLRSFLEPSQTTASARSTEAAAASGIAPQPLAT